eukprot:gene6750-49029_t
MLRVAAALLNSVAQRGSDMIAGSSENPGVTVYDAAEQPTITLHAFLNHWAELTGVCSDGPPLCMSVYAAIGGVTTCDLRQLERTLLTD